MNKIPSSCERSHWRKMQRCDFQPPQNTRYIFVWHHHYIFSSNHFWFWNFFFFWFWFGILLLLFVAHITVLSLLPNLKATHSFQQSQLHFHAICTNAYIFQYLPLTSWYGSFYDFFPYTFYSVSHFYLNNFNGTIFSFIFMQIPNEILCFISRRRRKNK